MCNVRDDVHGQVAQNRRKSENAIRDWEAKCYYKYMKGGPRGIQVRYSGRAQARTWGEISRDGYTAGGGDGDSVARAMRM
jgi:hypothetical protein